MVAVLEKAIIIWWGCGLLGEVREVVKCNNEIVTHKSIACWVNNNQQQQQQ